MIAPVAEAEAPMEAPAPQPPQPSEKITTDDRLPPGWVRVEKVSAAGNAYKKYRGPPPKNLRAQSIAEAWRKERDGDGSVPGNGESQQPAPLPVAIGVSEGVTEGAPEATMLAAPVAVAASMVAPMAAAEAESEVESEAEAAEMEQTA